MAADRAKCGPANGRYVLDLPSIAAEGIVPQLDSSSRREAGKMCSTKSRLDLLPSRFRGREFGGQIRPGLRLRNSMRRQFGLIAVLLSGALNAGICLADPVARILQVAGPALVVSEAGLPREADLYGAVSAGERLLLLPGGTVALGFAKDGRLQLVSASQDARILEVSIAAFTPSSDGVIDVDLDVEAQRNAAVAIRALPPVPPERATLTRGQLPATAAVATTPIEESTVTTARPSFSWPSMEGAVSYEVTLSHGGDRLWSATSRQPNLGFPSDAPLDRKGPYEWEVTGETPTGRQLVCRSSFTVIDHEDAEWLSSMAARPEPCLRALAALRYEKLGMFIEAMSVYRALLEIAPQEPTILAALSELSSRAGNTEIAGKARQAAYQAGFDFSAPERMDAEQAASGPSQQTLAHSFRVLQRMCWEPTIRAAASQLSRDPSQFAEAEHSVRRSLSASADLLTKAGVSPEVASLGQLELATLQLRLQRYESTAETLDKLSRSIRQPQVWQGAEATYWSLRGLIAAEQSRYAQALDDHTRALKLRQGLSLTVSAAESLTNLGAIFLQLGDARAARDSFQRAADIYGQVDSSEYFQLPQMRAFTAIGLSKAWEVERDFDHAERLLQGVANEQQTSPAARDAFIEILCHNNLGLLLYNLGRFDECRRELSLSAAAAAQQWGPTHIRTIESRANQGWIDFTTGNLPAAEESFRAALEAVIALSADHQRIPEFKTYLARVLAAKHQSDEASRLLVEALDARKRETLRILNSALSQRDRLAFVQMLRVHTESIAWPGVLDAFLELAPSLGISAERQYSYVLAWKGILERGAGSVPKAGENPEAARLLGQLRAVRSEIRRIAGAAAGVDDPSRLAELESSAAGLERQLRKLLPGSEGLDSVQLSHVAGALPPASALVDLIEVRTYLPRAAGEIVQDNRSYIAFVVEKTGSVSRIDLGSAAEIDLAIDKLVERISKQQTILQQANAVARRVVDPMRQALGDAKLIVISADGSLHRLPWAALPGKQATFWLEEVAFTMVPSAHSLVQPRREFVAGDPTWLVVGGVDYGTPTQGDPRWNKLSSSRLEADRIARVLQDRFPAVSGEPMLADGDATKQAVVSRLESRSFVHLATHGGFQDRRREAFETADLASYCDSFLVFAGANAARDSNDAILTAEEIGDLDLHGVELVTLSACETALGHVLAGQGLIGLVDAFTHAGARAVVSSLWSVDDRATAALMEHFYEHLMEGTQERNVPECLRRAQLDLLHDESEGYSHPVFWAAWTASAAPSPPATSISQTPAPARPDR